MRRLVALAVALAGCGPSSFNDFREQLLRRSCDRAIRCGLAGASEKASCPAPPELAQLAPGPLDVGAEIAAGRMRFSSGGAQDCLDAIGGAPCAPGALQARINLRCHHVYAPKVAPGGECRGDGECEGGSCERAGCPGTCVAFPPPGAPCTPPGGCDPSVQYCGLAKPGAGYTCLKHKQEGDACSDGSECAFGLLCIAAKCSAPPRGGQPGDPCDDPSACAESLYCDAGTHHCAPHVPFGGTCLQPEACGDGLVCLGLGAPGASGTCKSWLDVGQGCSPLGGVSGCPASQSCDAAAGCKLRAPVAGERQSCASAPCAAGLACDGAQTCAFPLLVGGKCSSFSLCAGGLTCDAALMVCVGAAGVCAN